jgi:hypothetical protein
MYPYKPPLNILSVGSSIELKDLTGKTRYAKRHPIIYPKLHSGKVTGFFIRGARTEVRFSFSKPLDHQRVI